MKKIKNILKNKYVIMLLFFVIILIMHMFYNFSNDDVNYFNSILDNKNIIDFVIERYNNWSSRVIIESLLVIVSRNIYLWRVLDSLVIVLLVYSINKLFYKKMTWNNLLFTCLIFFVYPFLDMTGAGFCATTLNYLWPLTFMLFGFIPFRNNYYGEKIDKRLLIFYVLALVYACNQEQSVCIVFGVSLIYLMYCIKTKRDIKYVVMTILIALASLIFIAGCPGNVIRKAVETTTHNPVYKYANFLDKIYMGIVSTMSILLSNLLVLLALISSLFVFIIRKKENLFVKIIGSSLFLIILIIGCLKINTVIYKKRLLLFNYASDVKHAFLFDTRHIFALVISVLFIVTVIYILVKLLKENSILPIIIILMGCASRVIMGFSPTVFVSGSRTMIFMYFSLLFIIIQLFNSISLKKKSYIVFIIVFSSLAIVNYGYLFMKI